MPLAQNGQGGGGGSVLSASGSAGLNEGVNDSFAHSFQNGEGVDSVLLSHGVFALSPAKRKQVDESATQLQVGWEELRDLLAHIRDGEPNEGTARRYMAAIVSDPIRFRDAIDGLRAFKRAQDSLRRATKPVDVGPPHMVNLPLGVSSCPCVACVQARAKQPPPEPWDHDRQCRIAHCLVVSDKRSRTEVAELLGVSETTLGVMLDRGRTLSTSALPIVKGRKPSEVRKMDDAEKERREQFHRMMREARMRKEMAL